MKKRIAIIFASVLLVATVGSGCGNYEPVKDGDTVNIDFVGTINGVPFAGGTAKGYTVVVGSGRLIPGFEEQLIGMKVKDVKDINVTFPLDYHTVSLRGESAVFKVTLNSIN